MRWLGAILAAFGLALSARAEPPARLDGWAVLPAQTFVAKPNDAGADLNAAGKYLSTDGPQRTPDAARQRDGGALPAAGQVVQGISALRAAGAGSFWALSDNGFGAKANSPDAMLMLHRLRIDWTKKSAERSETIFLTDPNFKAPFRIAQEGARTRYLTGADFDTESLVVRADGGFVLGDEFGPFLLGFDAKGQLEWIVEAAVNGAPVRGPDNPKTPAPNAGEVSTATIGRSKGFEGLAASADGKTLYAMLEGPARGKDGVEAGLRILAFDLASRAWTGESWLYTLEDTRFAIGEIALVAAGKALVIERDNGEGLPQTACPPDPPNATPVRPLFVGCHPNPARFKKVFAVDLPAGGGVAVKRASFDLLAIADLKRLAASTDGARIFTFPFQTIEAIEPMPDGRLLIANDNNYPFSEGRRADQLDPTEFILVTPPPGFLSR